MRMKITLQRGARRPAAGTLPPGREVRLHGGRLRPSIHLDGAG